MEKKLLDFRWLRVLPLMAALMLMSFSIGAQTITGKVTDEHGDGLVGVNILVKGTTSGTISDMNGDYTLTAPEGSTTLILSSIGYKNKEVEIAGQTTIDVQMEVNEESLEEVVVVGYGTVKKKLVTGANLNIKGEDIQALNTTSAMDALKGISPGVTITQNSGQPGSGSKVYIRGIGTVGNSTPLYVVDGVYQGNIDYLNPNDIESIDVLKDAASAAIYGSQGANGVILVTTKKGTKNMKTVVTYDGVQGWQNVYKKPDLLNAKEYALMMDEAVVNAGLSPHNYASLVPRWDEIENGTWNGTNWFDEIMVKDAYYQSHSLNILGGSEKSIYSLGASYLNQDGIIGQQSDSYFKRTNVRLNSEHVVFSKGDLDLIKVGENITYTNTKNNSIRQGNIYWNDVHNAMVASPFLPVYDESGKYSRTIDWNENDANPVALMEYLTKYAENSNNQVVSAFYIDIQPIKNLVLHSNLGLSASWGAGRSWIPEYDLGTKYITDGDKVSQNSWNSNSLVLTNTITYDFSLSGEHNFTAMIGNEIRDTKTGNSLGISNKNSLFQDWQHAYVNNASNVSSENATSISGKDEFGWRMLSYFGRLSWNLKETYLLSVLMRADASTNFGENHQWGYFPSVSGGWVASNESFLSGTKGWLDFLKIRASWGQVGNQSIKPFLYSATIGYRQENTSGGYYNGSYGYGQSKDASRLIGSYPARIPNPEVKWETSEQTDIGFDAHFLNTRLQVSFDWYDKNTKDWLLDTPIPKHNGNEKQGMIVNGGNVNNKGIELSLNWNDKIGDLKYGATVSFTHNKNEVTLIDNAEKIIHGPSNVLSQGTGELFRAEEGYPIGYFWGLQTDGIIQNEAEAAAWVRPTGSVDADGNDVSGTPYYDDQTPGDLRWVDQNHDGVINDDDKVMIGDPNPDYVLGIQLNFEYKGIYLNATANGAFGQQIAKSYRSFADSYKNNYTTDIFGRWHGEGTSDKIPRLLSSPHRNSQNLSDLYIQDGDFLRISNITIGYNFKQFLKNLPVSEARLYFTAKNLYTFTKYDGMDPEIGYGDDVKVYPWASGIDLGLYPSARTYLIGLSLKF